MTWDNDNSEAEDSDRESEAQRHLQVCPTFWYLWAPLEKELSGPHSKYIATHNHKEKKNPYNVLSKSTILCWVAFIAILSCMQPTGHSLDTLEPKVSPIQGIKKKTLTGTSWS